MTIFLEPSPFLIIVCGATSAFLIGISLIPVRSSVVERLERLEGIQEKTVAKRLEQIDKVTTEMQRSKIQNRLSAAGWYRASPAALTLRQLGGLAGGAAFGLTLMMLLPNKTLAALLAVTCAALGSRLPVIAVDRAIKARRRAIAIALPDFLDLLAGTVRAGLALNAALIQSTEAQRGPLQDELRSTLAEIKLGRPRSEALRALADRVGEPQLRSVVSAIVQAERLGSNLSHVLRELAADARNARWMRAEENAQRVPIKMVFPMVLLMLPALYLMIFGPAVARIFMK